MAWMGELWCKFTYNWLPWIVMAALGACAVAGVFVVTVFTAALVVWSFRTLGWLP